MHSVEIALSEAGQLAAGSQTAGDEHRIAIRGGRRTGPCADITVAFPHCQPGGSGVDLFGPLLEPVLGQNNAVGPEGVGFDDVGAGLQVGPVDAGDFLRCREGEHFVAAGISAPFTILNTEFVYLSAHCTVKQHDMILQIVKKFHIRSSASLLHMLKKNHIRAVRFRQSCKME